MITTPLIVQIPRHSQLIHLRTPFKNPLFGRGGSGEESPSGASKNSASVEVAPPKGQVTPPTFSQGKIKPLSVSKMVVLRSLTNYLQ